MNLLFFLFVIFNPFSIRGLNCNRNESMNNFIRSTFGSTVVNSAATNEAILNLILNGNSFIRSSIGHKLNLEVWYIDAPSQLILHVNTISVFFFAFDGLIISIYCTIMYIIYYFDFWSYIFFCFYSRLFDQVKRFFIFQNTCQLLFQIHNNEMTGFRDRKSIWF